MKSKTKKTKSKLSKAEQHVISKALGHLYLDFRSRNSLYHQNMVKKIIRLQTKIDRGLFS